MGACELVFSISLTELDSEVAGDIEILWSLFESCSLISIVTSFLRLSQQSLMNSNCFNRSLTFVPSLIKAATNCCAKRKAEANCVSVS